jgi:type II secretory pathway pseudopilin PulG
MARGTTLVELVIALTLAGIVLALAVPRLAGVRDGIAADAAARDVTTAIAVARQAAMFEGRRTRLTVTADSLAVDVLGPSGWVAHTRWPGPASRGVGVATSNAVITFAPTGIAWGASNTGITLTRGSHLETVFVSRLGRVRRG